MNFVVGTHQVELASQSVGISELKGDVTAMVIAEIEHKVKEVVQEANKFKEHCKRSVLTTEDINSALRLKGYQVFSFAFSFSSAFLILKNVAYQAYIWLWKFPPYQISQAQ
jgi:histone H3/H4